MKITLRPRYLVLAALAGMAVWVGLYPLDWQAWLGFTKADYFTEGQNYALFSGFLPVLVSALGLSSILGTVLAHVNCHVTGCVRISRHKIADGEHGVCTRHWREINHLASDHKFTVAHLRARHNVHLGLHRAVPGPPAPDTPVPDTGSA